MKKNIKKTVTKVKDAVSSAKGKVNSTTSKVDGIKSKADNIKNKAEDLKSKLDDVKNTNLKNTLGLVKDKMYNIDQPYIGITAWMSFDGSSKDYELSYFRVAFHQATDSKGQPQHEMQGGRLILTLSESIGEDIYGWMMRPGEKKNGTIVFKTEGASAPLRITFTNAYCVTLKRQVESIGGGLYTSLVLSPEHLVLNEMEFDNFWTE